MTMISDLSFDLVEEIFSRVPLTSLREVRFTCKQWNALCKDNSFRKKHCGKAAKEFLLDMNYGFPFNRRGLCIQLPARFSLHNIEDLPSTHGIRNIRCPVIDNFDKFYQCDGLFLCACQDESTMMMMLWNPYTGQTRLVNTRDVLDGAYVYAIGHDNNNNHKVLEVLYDSSDIAKLQIYNFKSNSWRVLDITTDLFINRGVSVKGNTYFVFKKRSYEEEGFIICFDFTTERFGQRLPLPFHCNSEDDVYPSCVREEQLAVLHQKRRITYELEIWITSKIEPNAMSWSICFKVDIKPLAGSHFVSSFYGKSFFIDKEKKVVVVCGTIHEKKCSYKKSYIVGGDGNYEEIDLDNVFSYVPSPVLIQ